MGPSHLPGLRAAIAPGRLTLVGDHTDYCRGRSLAVAIDLGTRARFRPLANEILEVHSRELDEPLAITLPVDGEAAAAGSTRALLTGLLRSLPDRGRGAAGRLEIDGDLPVGAGLSSSASMLLATALALGIDEPVLELARRCSRAESIAGQDGGLLDQLAILTGRENMATLLDFATCSWRHLELPDGAALWLVDSGERRVLAESRYRERRTECAAAEALIGSLADASSVEVAALGPPLLRARARHVTSENQRVDEVARLLPLGDLVGIGGLMDESHSSLSQDFEVSTTGIDELQARLKALPGVLGARLVGGGFGGCLVALSEDGVLDAGALEGLFRVHPSDGARLL
jgi:galactokinase